MEHLQWSFTLVRFYFMFTNTPRAIYRICEILFYDTGIVDPYSVNDSFLFRFLNDFVTIVIIKWQKRDKKNSVFLFGRSIGSNVEWFDTNIIFIKWTTQLISSVWCMKLAKVHTTVFEFQNAYGNIVRCSIHQLVVFFQSNCLCGCINFMRLKVEMLDACGTFWAHIRRQDSLFGKYYSKETFCANALL